MARGADPRHLRSEFWGCYEDYALNGHTSTPFYPHAPSVPGVQLSLSRWARSSAQQANMEGGNECSVQVALRVRPPCNSALPVAPLLGAWSAAFHRGLPLNVWQVRPMLGNEKDGNCKTVVRAKSSKQLLIGSDSPRPFTFDFVFDQHQNQV